MTIFLAVFIICGTQLGLFFWGSRAVSRYIERKQAALGASVLSEIEHLVKGEPCQTATVLLAIGRCVGQEAGRSAQAGLMNSLGQVTRLTNQAAEGGTIDAISQAQPVLGGILGSIPQRQRRGLLKNPLVQLALQGLMGSGGKVPESTPGNNEHRSSFSL